MSHDAETLASSCAVALTKFVNQHSEPRAEQAALVIGFTDSGDVTAPLRAVPYVVLESERQALLETPAFDATADWRRLWDDPSLTYALGYQFDEFEDERHRVAEELRRRGSFFPDQDFWPLVARSLNAGPYPDMATAHWCAVAFAGWDQGRGIRCHIKESVAPDLFDHLLTCGLVGPDDP